MTDGHELHPSRDASTPHGTESFGRCRGASGCFSLTTLWPSRGTAEEPARKRGLGDRQTDRQHARGGTDKTAVSGAAA